MAVSYGRIFGWSLLGLGLAAAITWSFWPRPELVDLERVTRGPFQVTVQDEAKTRVRDAYVVSAPVGGRLLRVPNYAGDEVIAGQTIVAQLEPSEPAFLDSRARAQAEARVKAATAARSLSAADLRQAQAEVDNAVSELKRVETLAPRGLVAQVELERAQMRRQKAAAGLESARSALNVKQFELENARMLLTDFSGVNPEGLPFISLKAPVTGRVFRVLQKSESVVAAGTPILEIGNSGDIEIAADMLSTDAVKVRPGATAWITDWGGPKELAARVRLIEPSGFTKFSALGVEEQRVKVVLDIVEPREVWAQLGDGFRVNVRIAIWESGSELRVPLGALFRLDQSWAVFVARGARVSLTPVSVGQANGRDAQVIGGLEEGDSVVLHPSDRIRDGTRIAVRPR
jgi:HlyD family secretion protein